MRTERVHYVDDGQEAFPIPDTQAHPRNPRPARPDTRAGRREDRRCSPNVDVLGKSNQRSASFPYGRPHGSAFVGRQTVKNPRFFAQLGLTSRY